jgi:hypothetical protein
MILPPTAEAPASARRESPPRRRRAYDTLVVFGATLPEKIGVFH